MNQPLWPETWIGWVNTNIDRVAHKINSQWGLFVFDANDQAITEHIVRAANEIDIILSDTEIEQVKNRILWLSQSIF